MFVLSVDLKDGNMNQRIHVVFDIYKDTFIMNIERLAKGEELGLELKNITAAQIVSQGREFLGYAGNKSSLIQFPVEEWKPRGSNTEKHTWGSGRPYVPTCQIWIYGYNSVLISSGDIDVFVMCLAFDADI